MSVVIESCYKGLMQSVGFVFTALSDDAVEVKLQKCSANVLSFHSPLAAPSERHLILPGSAL